MSAMRVTCTKDYSIFGRDKENRPTNLERHKPLIGSMKRYGFLKCFPIICRLGRGGKLIIRDGQHRLACAQSLGIPVYYFVTNEDFDIAVVNSTVEKWVLRDYAEKFVGNGKDDYRQGLEFAAEHGLPLGIAFGMLAGYTTFTGCRTEFISGNFKVTDKAWATSVANIYVPLCKEDRALKTQRFVEACQAVCRVPSFKPDRLLHNATRCREKLRGYSHRDSYLQMLEDIYNYGRRDLVGLKNEAVMAMRKRNPCGDAKEKLRKKAA